MSSQSATADSNQSPQPQPESLPSDPGSGSSDVDFVGAPLGDDEWSGGPPVQAAAPARPDPSANAGEAIIATQLFGLFVATKLGRPLDIEESAELTADLQAVLAKHGVPSILPPEEAKLVGTVTKIVLPRVIERASAGQYSDKPVSREAGRREDRPRTENRVPGAPAGSVNIGSLARSWGPAEAAP